MRYHLSKPSPPLREAVDYVWYLSDFPGHARERIVPSGTMELVINLQEDEAWGASVSGCYGAPFEIDTRTHASIMGVHFRPGGGAGLLGAPPGELADTHVSLEELWGPAATELRERLCAAPDLRQRVGILEGALAARLQATPARAAVRAALPRFEERGVEVGAVTDSVGLSRRRFIEVFAEDVGMTPKRYARVRRFQRALALATQRPSPAWADIALACGYFDQAHLYRDWTEFTGVPPGEFLSLRATPVKDLHVALPSAGVKSVQYAAGARA